MDDEQILVQYVDESLSNLALIDKTLLALEKDLQNLELVQVLYRAMHSIKGSTAFFTLPGVEKLAHELETILQKLTKLSGEQRLKLIESNRLLDLFFRVSDHLKLKMQELRSVSPEAIEIDFVLLEQVSFAGVGFEEDQSLAKPKTKQSKLSDLQKKHLQN